MDRYLKMLEDESIFIIREVYSAFEKPVMLYSIGKDSSVLLHLLRKAFYPSTIPFPVLHIDTTWKFNDMIVFREKTAKALKLDLIVHTNKEGLTINPIDHDATTYTDIMKTQALKQALEKYGFNAAIGGARRDEEKSRAKERIFSLRSKNHQWDPKNQCPEFWRNYNTLLGEDESMRVFPLSNWTEIDVWEYIKCERIDIVPLYFAKKRSVVKRNDQWIMVDDARFTLKKGEKIEQKMVRFRTLGCYPLTAAIESEATTLDDIIHELKTSKVSERQGRIIDHDHSASMEKKKKDGYF